MILDQGYNWTNIGTIGTTVLSNQPTQLVRVVVPGTYVGTVSFDDASTAAGTTTTSQILSLGIPATAVAGNIEVWAHCSKGLLVSATGTPTLTIIWN